MRWLVHAFRIARDTGTVFHGFGQTNLDIIKALPFYSVDSSTWASGARYGKVRIWDGVRGRMTEFQAGDHTRAHRHAAQLQAHGMDPSSSAAAASPSAPKARATSSSTARTR